MYAQSARQVEEGPPYEALWQIAIGVISQGMFPLG
jgi:hypothetical protein